MNESQMAEEVFDILPVTSNSVGLFYLSDVGKEPFCPVKIGMLCSV